MRVHFGGDHAAFELKSVLIDHVRALGHEPIDHGPFKYDSQDDYPVYVLPCAQAVKDDPDSLGIVLGGSGNGEQIAANKIPGIRCGLGHNVETARLAREHNNAHCLAIGSRMSSPELAKSMVTAFLETPFTEDPRHQRRVAMLEEFEAHGDFPESD